MNGGPSASLVWSLRLVVVGALALGWQWLAIRVPSLLVPTLPEVFAALARLLTTFTLWEALWVSNQAMVLGFVSASAAGISLGLAMGRYPGLGRFVDPYLSVLLVTPMAALIPIVIMATGLGLLSRALVVFTFAFVTIAINARAGLRMVDPSWIEMARAFGASERDLWRRILLPGARPAVLMGLRLGLIRAVSGMITMELLLVAVGVGRLINDFEGNLEAGEMFATVVVVIGEAVLLTHLFRKWEDRAAPWGEHPAGE